MFFRVKRRSFAFLFCLKPTVPLIPLVITYGDHVVTFVLRYGCDSAVSVGSTWHVCTGRIHGVDGGRWKGSRVLRAVADRCWRRLGCQGQCTSVICNTYWWKCFYSQSRFVCWSFDMVRNNKCSFVLYISPRCAPLDVVFHTICCEHL